LCVMHMDMVARRRAGYIVRKHGFLPVRSYGFLRLRPMGSRRAPHSGLGQFGRFESRHSLESKTVRSRRGLFTGVRGRGILRTSQKLYLLHPASPPSCSLGILLRSSVPGKTLLGHCGHGLRLQLPARLSPLIGKTTHTAISQKLGSSPEAPVLHRLVSCECRQRAGERKGERR
jgi:hypothetical protein